MQILAISGSLRAESSNTALVRAITKLAPEHMHFTIYKGLDDLPYCSPERDRDEPLSSVSVFRELLKASDGVLICTPEYAHGMPGVLKNALEWVVGSGELVDKPIACISASPSSWGGAKAHAWLVQTLSVMSAKIVEGASLSIPFFVRAKIGSEGHIMDSELNAALISALEALAQAINTKVYLKE